MKVRNKRKIGFLLYFIGVVLLGCSATYQQFHYIHLPSNNEYALIYLLAHTFIVIGGGFIIWEKTYFSGNVANVTFKIFNIGVLSATTLAILSPLFSIFNNL